MSYQSEGFAQTASILGSSQSVINSGTISNFTVECGSNRVLVVRVYSRAGGAIVTFNGQTLTEVTGARAVESNSTEERISIHYLLLGTECNGCTGGSTSPDVVGDVTISTGGFVALAVATTLENVDQLAPIRSFNSYSNYSGLGVPDVPTTLTLNGLQTGDVALDMIIATGFGTLDANASNAGPGQTDIITDNNSADGGTIASLKSISAAGSTTFSYNRSSAGGGIESTAIGAVAFSHATTSTPCTLTSTPANVPTMGQWGLLILGLLLVTICIVILKGSEQHKLIH